MTQRLARLTLPLTALAMLAFAGNSVLNRLALDSGAVGPALFALIRIISGALMLALLIAFRKNGTAAGKWRYALNQGSWAGAASLYVYAAAFSFAYLALDAGLGALLLFASVQFTMIGVSLWRGMGMTRLEILGTVIAGAALVYLLSPGLSAPPLNAALLMILAGIAWGGYSLLGANASDAAAATTGNFLRAVPLALPAILLIPSSLPLSWEGAGLAGFSGAVTSGLGYVLWYRVVPDLGSIRAAVVQLTVPVLAGLMGAIVLFEIPSLRLAVAGLFILGGVGLTFYARASATR